MSEMKAGLSQDENGEFLDASKVETALKSVGVALRNSQGQFRDLDQVIIELGSKWSSLDSATKRYLGTIIAGNRFIILLAVCFKAKHFDKNIMKCGDFLRAAATKFWQ